MERLDPDQGQRRGGDRQAQVATGQNITILGSGALVGSLLRGDLLDELRLMVHSGLFDGGGDRKALVLVDSKSFGTGDLCLMYHPPQT